MIQEATLVIGQDELLPAIWYPDGSGNHGLSADIDTTPYEWRIHTVSLNEDNGDVWIRLRRKRQEDMQK